METRQRYAVASLLGQCESIAASGRLTAPAEQSLRLLIAETASAFGMQVRECELAAFETNLTAIRNIMGAANDFV